MHDQSVVFRETADGTLVAPSSCGLLTVPDLISYVRSWCATGPASTLVVDLSHTVHVDTAAFRALVWARRYCATAGREMAIVPPGPGVLTEQEELLLQSLISVWPGQEVPAEPLPARPAAVLDGLGETPPLAPA